MQGLGHKRWEVQSNGTHRRDGWRQSKGLTEGTDHQRQPHLGGALVERQVTGPSRPTLGLRVSGARQLQVRWSPLDLGGPRQFGNKTPRALGWLEGLQRLLCEVGSCGGCE